MSFFTNFARRMPTHSILTPATALLALVIAAYIPAIMGGFVWDDDDYVTRNPTLRDSGGLQRIWFDIGAVPQYYPLVHTSFWLEFHLWSLWPLGYHLVNVLLHGCSAILLWRVLLRLGVRGAWLAAAVFALHPVQVESVAWVTERKNVLSGLFYLSALLAYVRFLGLERGGFGPSQGRRWYWLALVLFLCALLSKTVACSLPAAILLLLWWKRSRLRLNDVLLLVPFFVLGAALGLTTAWMEQHYVGAQGAEWALSWLDRCLIAGRALWFYVGKLVWPARLAFIYPRWQIDSSLWQYCYPLAAVALVVCLWVLRRRIGRAPLVAVLYFGGTLGPALGFIDVYPMRFSFVADHFPYMASIGLLTLMVGLLTTGLDRLARAGGGRQVRSPAGLGMHVVRLAVPAALLGVLAVLTWRQGGIYKNPETLWRDTIAKNPSAWLAQYNLGVTLDKQGRIAEAISHYRQALEIKPDHAPAHINWGLALSRQGKVEEAIAHYGAAIQIWPHEPSTYNNLGLALAQQGKSRQAIDQYYKALQLNADFYAARYNLAVAFRKTGNIEQAKAHYTEALRIKPDSEHAHNDLGSILARQGRFDEAITHFLEVLRINPNQAQAHNNLANALLQQGNASQAMTHYYQAIRIKPDCADAHYNLASILVGRGKSGKAAEHLRQALLSEPDHTGAMNNLAWLLATCPEQDIRDGAEAVRLAKRACQLTDHQDPKFLDTLAAAHAETGQFDQAIATAERAINLATSNGQAGLAKEIRTRLELYQSAGAYRQEPAKVHQP